MTRLVVGIDPGSHGKIAAVIKKKVVLVDDIVCEPLEYSHVESDKSYFDVLKKAATGRRYRGQAKRKKNKKVRALEIAPRVEHCFSEAAFYASLEKAMDIAKSNGFCGLFVHLEMPVVLTSAGITHVKTAISVGRSRQMLLTCLDMAKNSFECFDYAVSTPSAWKSLYASWLDMDDKKLKSITIANKLFNVPKAYKDNDDVCEALLLSDTITRFASRYTLCQCT